MERKGPRLGQRNNTVANVDFSFQANSNRRQRRHEEIPEREDGYLHTGHIRQEARPETEDAYPQTGQGHNPQDFHQPDVYRETVERNGNAPNRPFPSNVGSNHMQMPRHFADNQSINNSGLNRPPQSWVPTRPQEVDHQENTDMGFHAPSRSYLLESDKNRERSRRLAELERLQEEQSETTQCFMCFKYICDSEYRAHLIKCPKREIYMKKQSFVEKIAETKKKRIENGDCLLELQMTMGRPETWAKKYYATSEYSKFCNLPVASAQATPENSHLCSICIEGLSTGEEFVLTPCQHIFHDHCLSRWLENSRTCPSCRKDIPLQSRPRTRDYSVNQQNGSRAIGAPTELSAPNSLFGIFGPRDNNTRHHRVESMFLNPQPYYRPLVPLPPNMYRISNFGD